MNLSHVLIVALAMFSSQGFAHRKNQSPIIQRINFKDCGGFAKVREFPNQVKIGFHNIKRCQKLKIDGVKYHLNRTHGKLRSLHISLDKTHHESQKRIALFSRHKYHRDTATIWVPAKHRAHHSHHHPKSKVHLTHSGDRAQLPECQGQMKVRETHRHLVVKYKNLRYCNQVTYKIGDQRHVHYGRHGRIVLPKHSYQDRFRIKVGQRHHQQDLVVIHNHKHSRHATL
ncbi:hypothetical protein [Pseudobacteriovorax antillogorgiicola]|uniref:Uncharacterized protein n=1 Tax=Pseudobacteriovorax antillogorgiicola TaxID=1513793 RepID=A0A1Y6CGK2_9BACT|nr:hypothetical protein [Pseudobacteriovorax antillogorgiicola]TCS49079.1 hypothetical protein EDD56_116122 [Pseudobacteriovorax antillogorgiicola]SMF52048.1 hypothetical protein SAMN06296036_11632 [Pseudobacteriovorax antillogorgiicola]